MADMRADMRVDMRIDMCIDVCRHVCGHVHRHGYRRAREQVCRHAEYWATTDFAEEAKFVDEREERCGRHKIEPHVRQHAVEVLGGARVPSPLAECLEAITI